MARTKQTTRLAVPTHDEVAAALVVSQVPMKYSPSPPDPLLSRSRCTFLCALVEKSFGGHLFAAPVDWRALNLMDYPRVVRHPMDLQTIRRFVSSDAFSFASFVDRMRLMWANACLYNPPDHPIHEITQRLASMCEATIVSMQTRPEDDDPGRLCMLFVPSLSVMIDNDDRIADSAVYSVDMQAVDESYTSRVLCPFALRDVIELLNMRSYVSRVDVINHVSLCFDNAAAVSDDKQVCDDLASTRDRVVAICSALAGDLDLPYFVVPEMREQVQYSLSLLDDATRRTLLNDVVSKTGVDADGVTLELLTTREFVKLDAAVRHTCAERHLDTTMPSDDDDDDSY